VCPLLGADPATATRLIDVAGPKGDLARPSGAAIAAQLSGPFWWSGPSKLGGRDQSKMAPWGLIANFKLFPIVRRASRRPAGRPARRGRSGPHEGALLIVDQLRVAQLRPGVDTTLRGKKSEVKVDAGLARTSRGEAQKWPSQSVWAALCTRPVGGPAASSGRYGPGAAITGLRRARLVPSGLAGGRLDQCSAERVGQPAINTSQCSPKDVVSPHPSLAPVSISCRGCWRAPLPLGCALAGGSPFLTPALVDNSIGLQLAVTVWRTQSN